MLTQLFRTKPVKIGRHSDLKKYLSAFNIALLGIGCAIGTDIFVLTGIAAAAYSSLPW